MKRVLLVIGAALFVLTSWMISAASAEEGDVIWSVPSDAIDWVNPAIGPDGAVYFSDLSGNVYSVLDSGDRPTIKWRRDLNDEVEGLAKPFNGVLDLSECAPTLNAVGDRLYLGSHSSPGYVFCLNAADGRVVWKLRLPDNPLRGLTPGWTEDSGGREYPRRPWGRGGGIVSSPALSPDENTLYVGAGDWSEGNYEANAQNGNKVEYADIEDNRFFAIEDLGDSAAIKWVFQPDAETKPDGSPRWPSSTCRRSFFGSPAVASDGTVYIGSFNGYMYAIEDADDAHRIKWWWLSTNIDNDGIQEQEFWGSPSLSADEQTVYIGSNDWRLHAFSSQGAGHNPPKWSFNTWGEVYATPVITPQGRIIITSEGGPKPPRPESDQPEEGTGGHIYSLIDKGASVEKEWQFPTGEGVGFFFGNAAVTQDGTVVLSAETNDEFWGVDSTRQPGRAGFIKWKVSVGNETRTSAAIARDGAIYVCGGNSGGLFKLEGSSPLADTASPRMQRDNRNSGRWRND